MCLITRNKEILTNNKPIYAFKFFKLKKNENESFSLFSFYARKINFNDVYKHHLYSNNITNIDLIDLIDIDIPMVNIELNEIYNPNRPNRVTKGYHSFLLSDLIPIKKSFTYYYDFHKIINLEFKPVCYIIKIPEGSQYIKGITEVSAYQDINKYSHKHFDKKSIVSNKFEFIKSVNSYKEVLKFKKELTYKK